MECSAPGGDRTGLAPVPSTILERICHEAAGRSAAANTRGGGSMNRPITGFRLDDHGDWTARLSCGHAQHVRHTPPFTNRPWVTTASGRDSRRGEPLPCVRCDRFELPERVVAYQHTPVFTERSIRMCCNFSKAARERLVESDGCRLMPPPQTACGGTESVAERPNRSPTSPVPFGSCVWPRSPGSFAAPPETRETTAWLSRVV